MALVIEIGEIGAAVIVNGRAVAMLVIVMRRIRGMNVKGETLRLQRKERESREDYQATPHKPESMEARGARQRRRRSAAFYDRKDKYERERPPARVLG